MLKEIYTARLGEERKGGQSLYACIYVCLSEFMCVGPTYALCKYICIYLCVCLWSIFIHSFRIFIQHLFRSTTTQMRSGHCSTDTVSEFHVQLRVKDLPRVPTRRLERDSNPRPFGRKATNLPISHHAPRLCMSFSMYAICMYVCMCACVHA